MAGFTTSDASYMLALWPLSFSLCIWRHCSVMFPNRILERVCVCVCVCVL
jgi:hypothetical protein